MRHTADGTTEPADLVDPADLDAVAHQLNRSPRAVRAIAHRCPCGNPDVVTTAPRLPDGTPFPTLYYLTCPRATAAVSTLESTGLMRDLTQRLYDDPELAQAYSDAHQAYVSARRDVAAVPEIAGISAGGMPTRVKCLHVLVAHSLAAGPGVNKVGDIALAQLDPWWGAGPCVARPAEPSSATDTDSPAAGPTA